MSTKSLNVSAKVRNHIQTVRTASEFIHQARYLTKKVLRLEKEGASQEVLLKYTKNRYTKNPDSKVLTEINCFTGKNGLSKRYFGVKKPA